MGDLECFEGFLALEVNGWENDEYTCISLREAAQLMNPKNDFKCASCNCQSGCSTKRCYCKRNNTKSLSKCHGGKSCSNQPSEFEQDFEDYLKNDEREILQKQNYCKLGSQVKENEDKSTTGFVSLQNENEESGKEKCSKRQTQQLVFPWGVLTCILIKRTDEHSYTKNGSLTNIFMLHKYY